MPGGAGALSCGSSPRGRGKLVGLAVVVGGGRLIPARAGKTRLRLRRPIGWRAHPRAGGENHRSPRRRADDWAHPRAGGENTGDIEDAVREAGSSPRGRGKPHELQAIPHLAGLIPARAGKTWGRRS